MEFRKRFFYLRTKTIPKFSFAIPTAHVLSSISKYSPILEVGSGTGYWAYELSKLKVDIIATDPEPYSDIYLEKDITPSSWTSVQQINACDAIFEHGKGRVLMMCWPSLEVSWPKEALIQYRVLSGRALIYIGEGDGGCTADDEFHEILSQDWLLTKQIEMRQWQGIHDNCYIYVAK